MTPPILGFISSPKVMVKDQPAEAEGLRQAGADPATELELQPFSEDPTDEPMQVREI